MSPSFYFPELTLQIKLPSTKQIGKNQNKLNRNID